MKEQKKFDVISDRVLGLCISPESVSACLASQPELVPGDAWKKLYGKHILKATGAEKVDGAGQEALPEDELERARKCGKWGPTQPSELFLQIYHDALCTLEETPLHAMVSPSLMGSCGAVPLTVISVIPDIVRHMSNLIVRAEREVFLATNYWQDSVASKFLTDAIRELNRRAGERGDKIVFKIIYDRGSPKQVLEPHYEVSEKEYTGKNVRLPAAAEIPHIDLKVMNLVDRKIAVLQSNNIQDNDNLEMMIHLEGPIVDSLYDMALISWHKKLDPPLPSHNSPAAQGGIGSFGESHKALFGPGGVLNGTSIVIDPPKGQHSHAYGSPDGAVNRKVLEPGAVDPSAPAKSQNEERADDVTGPSTTKGTTHPVPERNDGIDQQPLANSAGEQYRSTQTETGAPAKTAEDFLNDGEQAIPPERIARPTAGHVDLPEHTADDPHYDDDIAGEVARVQNAVTGKAGESRMEAVSRLLNHTTNKGFKGDAPECPPGEEMTPYIPHPVHEPMPMALVCRNPYGPPNHKSVSNPQNAAWLSALRNAKKNVFIQSPTLNAEPLVPAIREACERGVDVYCYICLGYNDTVRLFVQAVHNSSHGDPAWLTFAQGELLPRQGGHNEMVAHNLYKSLSPAGRQHLHYFWYVAKDQTRPIPQEQKRRSCHIKLMIVDEHIGIQGNGNQDTQSWYHSQEINVMLDSEHICRAWIDGIRRNQNTHVYGALDKETGIWTDSEGKEAEGAMGVDPGRFSWAKGFIGAVKRVQGIGGF
ncbi:hypothetical protein GQ53DRAFT_758241 [Thozetella sp. PMI_491]|nr:hypothetical protein GQ53DRAFT_758241 [Thozetella sp. PMI_491]